MVIVTITNNSASPISNWAICFDYADSIENIWDAVIEANANGAYIIRNNVYNESIPVGGSVSFGFTSTYSENTVLPTFIKIVPNVVKPINADISYLVYYDDEYSLSSAILITNNTGSEIKNWTLTFDMDRSIQSVSNANVSGTDGISYALTYPEYASHIALGATTQIGVTGNAGVIGTTPTNYANEISNYLALREVDYSDGLIHNGGEEVVTGVAVLYAYLLDSGLSQEAIRSRMDYLNEDYTRRLSLLGNNSRNPAYSNGLARQINTSLDTTIETENRQRVFANYMAVCDTVAQFFVSNENIHYSSSHSEVYYGPGVINGMGIRTDCSGFVSAVLVQSTFLDISHLNSSSYDYEQGHVLVQPMIDAGFVWHEYYEGVSLQQGDIMLSSEHIEIFNGFGYDSQSNQIYSFYSWGTEYFSEPVIFGDGVYSHYSGYLGFWRYGV